MHASRILIIDDNTLLGQTLCEGLRMAGFDAMSDDNGERALEFFKAEHPDAVITDVLMPDREGIEVLREIKAEAPDTKVIAMSGGGRTIGPTPLLEMASRMGADAVLAKPFRLNELVSVLNRVLRGQAGPVIGRETDPPYRSH